MVSCPYCGYTVDGAMTNTIANEEYRCPACGKVFHILQIGRDAIPGIPYHKFINTTTKDIQIECDTISLKHKDLDIEVHLDHAIGNINSITINGIKFMRSE